MVKLLAKEPHERSCCVSNSRLEIYLKKKRGGRA